MPRLNIYFNKRRIDSVIIKKGQAYTVGRDKEALVRLPHKKISRFAAQIVFDGKRIKITDLESSTGIKINKKTISESFFKYDDLIIIGPFILKLARPKKKTGNIAKGKAGAKPKEQPDTGEIKTLNSKEDFIEHIKGFLSKLKSDPLNGMEKVNLRYDAKTSHKICGAVCLASLPLNLVGGGFIAGPVLSLTSFASYFINAHLFDLTRGFTGIKGSLNQFFHYFALMGILSLIPTSLTIVPIVNVVGVLFLAVFFFWQLYMFFKIFKPKLVPMLIIGLMTVFISFFMNLVVSSTLGSFTGSTKMELSKGQIKAEFQKFKPGMFYEYNILYSEDQGHLNGKFTVEVKKSKYKKELVLVFKTKMMSEEAEKTIKLYKEKNANHLWDTGEKLSMQVINKDNFKVEKVNHNIMLSLLNAKNSFDFIKTKLTVDNTLEQTIKGNKAIITYTKLTGKPPFKKWTRAKWKTPSRDEYMGISKASPFPNYLELKSKKIFPGNRIRITLNRSGELD